MKSKYSLYVHNDDIHSVDEIIALLTAICNLNPIQADQCACLIHHKHKFEVVVSKDLEALHVMRQSLDHFEIRTSIQQ